MSKGELFGLMVLLSAVVVSVAAVGLLALLYQAYRFVMLVMEFALKG